MQIRTLIFTIFLGLLSATVVTGCSEKEENKQESEHGHSHSHD